MNKKIKYVNYIADETDYFGIEPYKSTYYTLKCSKCGATQQIEDDLYNEEADFNKNPKFLCFKCNKYTMELVKDDMK